MSQGREIEVVSLTAHVDLPSIETEHVRALLRKGVDWPFLVGTANAQGTSPLLFCHLSRIASDLVPRDTLECLRQGFNDNARRNLFLTAELLKLLRLFSANGLRTLPFKGPTLAAFAYGSLALRRFIDLDFLFPPADLPKANEILVANGYRHGLPLPPEQIEAYLESIGQMPFIRGDRACMVELHSRIMPRDFYFPLGLERLWPRLRSLSINGADVPALSSEDLLLVLCAHGAKHWWARLGWICDVAELLRVKKSMNWQEVEEEARYLHCERILLLGILLAHDLLQAPAPTRLIRRARSTSAVLALARQVSRRITSEPGRQLSGLQGALFQFRARERPQDGIRYAISLALTPTRADWTSVRLPTAFPFLYYLFRPLRLFSRYLRLLFRGEK